MSHPLVVKRSDPHDMYIGRPSKWGNPFPLKSETERRVCVERFAYYLKRHPELIEAARVELAGKRLGCYCAPRLCHGDVLARVAEGMEPVDAFVAAREGSETSQ